MSVDLPPVRLIPRDDLAALVKTVRSLLKEPIQSDVPVRRDAVGLRARAVGAKSWPAFNRNARAFMLSLTPSTITVEEWRRQGYGFVASDPLWRIKDRPSGLEDVLQKLLLRVRGR